MEQGHGAASGGVRSHFRRDSDRSRKLSSQAEAGQVQGGAGKEFSKSNQIKGNAMKRQAENLNSIKSRGEKLQPRAN